MSIFAASFLISLFLTKVFMRVAVLTGFIDYPSDRKFHTQPVPLLGGAAVFFSFCITIGAGLAVVSFKPQILPELIRELIPGIKMRIPWISAIITAGFFIFAVGLIDDRINLKPVWKLCGQIITAIIIAAAGIRIRLFIPVDTITFFITIGWVVLIINSFNLLDNMDGICAGTAIIASGILLVISIALEQYFVSAILAVFIGSILGFLIFNFPPAKIFMGDCGSMFIGFMMSTVTILGTYYRHNDLNMFSVVIPIIVLAVPIFDTISVIYIRIRKGKTVFAPDMNHFPHRLSRIGMNPAAAAGFVYLLSLCIGLPAVLLPILPLSGVIVVFVHSLIIIFIVAILEFYKLKKEV